MTIVTSKDVFCNECLDWIATPAPSDAEARAYAKTEGWITTQTAEGKIIDLCPDCKPQRPRGEG